MKNQTKIQYIFFDTETNGLPKDYKAPVDNVENWPRLLQLAFQTFDSKGKQLNEFECIVKNDFELDQMSAKIHGITQQTIDEKGIQIADCLNMFKAELEKSDVNILIAHNMRFDMNVLGAEFIRFFGVNLIEKNTKVCTMLNTVDFCAIPGKFGFKWPKLQELHKKLFGIEFEDAHDALNDIRATSKIFWHMKNKGFNWEEL